jgi:hypothetical protein
MKKFKILALCLFGSLFTVGQTPYEQASLAQVQGDGSVMWHTTPAQLSAYLTLQLNNNLNITGNITSSTILLIDGIYKASGEGVGDNEDEVRNIRMDLDMDYDGELTFDFRASADTETCSGNPCSECAFATGGGCNCNRTTESPTGLGGKCDHTISRSSTL